MATVREKKHEQELNAHLATGWSVVVQATERKRFLLVCNHCGSTSQTTIMMHDMADGNLGRRDILLYGIRISQLCLKKFELPSICSLAAHSTSSDDGNQR